MTDATSKMSTWLGPTPIRRGRLGGGQGDFWRDVGGVGLMLDINDISKGVL